ncbi:MAG: DUF4010 domain-containing protein [Caenibius sp.]
MIAAISFGGYVLVRLFGERLGIIMAAMAGGLTSSTATTLTLARMGRDNGDAPHLLAGGILLSGVVMFARVGIVAGLLQPVLAARAGPAPDRCGWDDAGSGRCSCFASALPSTPAAALSPLDLRIALRFALLIALLMLASGLLHRWAGAAGVLGLAAVSGLVDVDAVTLSMARMGGEQIRAQPLRRARLPSRFAVGWFDQGGDGGLGRRARHRPAGGHGKALPPLLQAHLRGLA